LSLELSTKLNVELINGVAEYGSGFNALWHGTIMETDAALWRGLLVPTTDDNHDMAIAATSIDAVRRFKTEISQFFDITDLGEITLVLELRDSA